MFDSLRFTCNCIVARVLSQIRYAAGDIYTYTGAILLAVNPFYRINIYGEAKLAEYQREGAAKVQIRIFLYLSTPI